MTIIPIQDHLSGLILNTVGGLLSNILRTANGHYLIIIFWRQIAVQPNQANSDCSPTKPG